MARLEVQVEAWQNALDYIDDILEALEILTNNNAAIMNLVTAYGKECRAMERAMMKAGFTCDEEMISCCAERHMEKKKLKAVRGKVHDSHTDSD